VSESSGLSSAQAEQAIHATLTVLGERLAGGETKDLASQLPATFADDLPRQGAGERFSVQEFYTRVAYETRCTKEQARQSARAVTGVLKNSVTGREFNQISEQLSKDFDDLLV
jgi:uncharacterized protein (DUF2267 family)